MSKPYTPNDLRTLSKQSGPQWESEVRTALLCAADLLDAADLAVKSTRPYDQQALELCTACGWKTLIPGDCCLNCTRPNPDAPEQEPAGFIDECDDGLFANLETETGVMVKRGDKLYTKPQPVADLTDAEIRKVQVRHPTENDPMPFARAVLAAQKAKS